MTLTALADHPQADAAPAQRVALHVGCGAPGASDLPPEYFEAGAWRELRLDIDPAVRPDVVASITDMAPVADASVDAVFSSHNLEHLYAHEVPVALGEFLRVLRPGGFALVTMPDLQQVAALVAEGRLEEPAYVSPAGPVAPLDILYGWRRPIAAGNAFMAHRTGFVAGSLAAALERAGFARVQVMRDGRFALWGIGVRPA